MVVILTPIVLMVVGIPGDCFLTFTAFTPHFGKVFFKRVAKNHQLQGGPRADRYKWS